MKLSRRELIAGAVAAGLSSALSPAQALLTLPSPRRRRFRFAYLTDIHIQPELGAADGVALAVKKVLSLSPRPDFILTGGDHVMDALKASPERAELQFKLLTEALKPLEMPVHATVGNHDPYGWGRKDATQNDPLYGKKMLEERFMHAPSYRSFDFGDWHFVILDTIQFREGSTWFGQLDDAQLTWLADDLAKAGTKNKIVTAHVPVMSLITQYTEGTTKAPNDMTLLANGKEVHELLSKHQVRAVLQGHTHVIEECDYMGIKYITGGAVCGDWWKGYRLGIHPEGFMVFDVDGDKISSQYVTYGWKARTS